MFSFLLELRRGSLGTHKPTNQHFDNPSLKYWLNSPWRGAQYRLDINHNQHRFCMKFYLFHIVCSRNFKDMNFERLKALKYLKRLNVWSNRNKIFFVPFNCLTNEIKSRIKYNIFYQLSQNFLLLLFQKIFFEVKTYRGKYKLQRIFHYDCYV